MPHARVVIAAITETLQNVGPGACNHSRVLRGEVGPGHDEVHQWLGNRVILGLDDSAGLGLVAGQQTFLLAGAAVFVVKNFAAPEQFEAVFHVRAFQFTNTNSKPLRSSGGIP